MNPLTTLATTAAAAVVAVSGLALPANAEAVVYETHTIQSNPPERPGHEYASLAIPTGYDKVRFNWHTVGFVEMFDGGRAIILDLHPKADTVKEFRAERRQFKEDAGDNYRELTFHVNGKDSKVRALWTFTHAEPGTGDVDPFVSVMLMSGNRLQITGRMAERDHVRAIRNEVKRSVVFPG